MEKLQAKDLRIGNIVYQGEIYLIAPITAYQIYNLELFNKGVLVSDYYKAFAPIELTEDWLKRFGFEYSKEREEISNGFEEWRKESIYLGNFNNKHYIIEALDQAAINVEIKYVHQLQNLYFSLTGGELTTDTK